MGENEGDEKHGEARPSGRAKAARATGAGRKGEASFWSKQEQEQQQQQADGVLPKEEGVSPKLPRLLFPQLPIYFFALAFAFLSFSLSCSSCPTAHNPAGAWTWPWWGSAACSLLLVLPAFCGGWVGVRALPARPRCLSRQKEVRGEGRTKQRSSPTVECQLSPTLLLLQYTN